MATKEQEPATVHWTDVCPVPVERWGRDHTSTVLYAETRAVDHGGWLGCDDRHMRVARSYPTRLADGTLVEGHTDYTCLADAQAAGLLVYDENEVPQDAARLHRVPGGSGRVRFTDAGWLYVHALRRARAERGLERG